MSAHDDPFDPVGRILNDASAEHALIGGHAVNTWVEPRFTADVDITLSADPVAVERVRVALEREGYRVEREIGAGLPSGPDFLRFSRGPDDMPIDLQTAKTEFQVELIKRAREADKVGSRLAVATAEDLIVLKLIAYRPKDLLDLQNLARRPSLDWDYVEHWAREWDITDRLARLRAGP